MFCSKNLRGIVKSSSFGVLSRHASATGTLAEAPRVPRVALKDEDGRAARGRRLGRLGFFVRRVCTELKGSKNPSNGLRLEGLGFWA